MDEDAERASLPATSLTNAEAMAWLDDLMRRGMVCLVAMLIAWVLAAVPLPFGAMPSFSQKIIEAFAAPMYAHLQSAPPDAGFVTYWHVSRLLALVLSHPVMLRHALDVSAPTGLPRRGTRPVITLIVGLASFLVGVVSAFAYFILTPLKFMQSLVIWNPATPAVMWSYVEFIDTVTTFTFATGLAFDVPAVLVGLVWLRSVSRERLARWRPYAILVAFIVGAVVTPTPDILNQSIVAIPMYLLHELGVLLARLVPAERVLLPSPSQGGGGGGGGFTSAR
jgi:sec-independent protein translocase protein TatC